MGQGNEPPVGKGGSTEEKKKSKNQTPKSKRIKESPPLL
jgi:hypothetical protein